MTENKVKTENKIVVQTGNYRLVEIITTEFVPTNVSGNMYEKKTTVHHWEHCEGKDKLGVERWHDVPDTYKGPLVEALTKLFLSGTAFFLIFILSGCLEARANLGDQANTQRVNQGPATVAMPLPELTTPQHTEASKPVADSDWFVAPIKAEVAASSNATQQSLTGLGLQVSKIGEHVEALHSEVNARFEAVSNAQIELKNRIEIDAKISAVTNAQIELKNRIDALAQAQASAIVGLGNRIENRNESIKAGGNVSQFTPEMKEVILNAQNETSFNLKILGGIMVALGLGTAYHNQRNHKANAKKIEATQAHFTKTLHAIEDHETKRVIRG